MLSLHITLLNYDGVKFIKTNEQVHKYQLYKNCPHYSPVVTCMPCVSPQCHEDLPQEASSNPTGISVTHLHSSNCKYVKYAAKEDFSHR